MLESITIYTDGACVGNPGPGGYGVVLIFGDYRKELSGGFKLTTNNRMELMATIVGLSALKKRCEVVLYTDSKYVQDGITKGWAAKWRSNNWMKSKKSRAKNPDLWQKLLELTEKHSVTIEWVPGHAGVKENERCDFLAESTATSPDLPVDEGYEEDFNQSANMNLF